MRHHPGRHPAVAHLCTLAAVALICTANGARAQIYLNPTQQTMTRSRVSIDMGDGLRCTSDGGSVPSLGVSIGAYPDQWGGNNVVFDSSRNTTNQSSLLGLVSVFVPLSKTSQSFDCKALLEDAQFKARLANLRDLLEDDLISESQYREAVQRLLSTLMKRDQGVMTVNPPPQPGVATITVPDQPVPFPARPAPPAGQASRTGANAPGTGTSAVSLIAPPPLPPLPKPPGSRRDTSAAQEAYVSP